LVVTRERDLAVAGGAVIGGLVTGVAAWLRRCEETKRERRGWAAWGFWVAGHRRIRRGTVITD
jgi:hypothetical protein